MTNKMSVLDFETLESDAVFKCFQSIVTENEQDTKLKKSIVISILLFILCM